MSYRHSQEDYGRMFLNTEHTGNGPEPSCVLYGDIHGTYLQGDDNQTLVNVGSVGNPLDATTASYVVVEGVADSLDPAPFGIQFVRVPFDTEAEIAVAFASGMPEAQEYAIELRTGLYRGNQQGASSSAAAARANCPETWFVLATTTRTCLSSGTGFGRSGSYFSDMSGLLWRSRSRAAPPEGRRHLSPAGVDPRILSRRSG